MGPRTVSRTSSSSAPTKVCSISVTWPLPGVAGLVPGHAIQPDLLGDLVDVLAQQVGQQLAAEFAGLLESLGIAGRGEPDRQLCLDRARQGLHVDGLAQRAREGDASPRHRRRTTSMLASISFLRLAKAAGAMTKSLGCQPDANDTPTRPCEMLSTKAHSSATRIGWCSGSTQLPARILQARGHGRDGRAGHRRIGVEAAEGVEMALGRPDGREAVLVGELRALPAAARTGPAAWTSCRWRSRRG